jgi:dTDP-4-dehydrorhamnose reductase
MKSRILLIGANGQLGSDLRGVLIQDGHEVIPRVHAELDICNAAAVSAELLHLRPEVVINTAAFHRVEDCETTKPDLAFSVNAVGVRNVALSCASVGAVLVHFSTDYVFSGRDAVRPYVETDAPDPLSVYGTSKLAGELLIAAVLDRYFTVRTCGLYGVAGSSGKGANFVETMLQKAAQGQAVRVVHDQVLTPTSTFDLASAVSQLIRTDSYGLYHVTSEGQCSWYEFARGIFELERIHANLTPVRTDDFPSPVKRPTYSVLSKEKLLSVTKKPMRHWSDALARYLRARGAERMPMTAAG